MLAEPAVARCRPPCPRFRKMEHLEWRYMLLFSRKQRNRSCGEPEASGLLGFCPASLGLIKVYAMMSLTVSTSSTRRVSLASVSGSLFPFWVVRYIHSALGVLSARPAGVSFTAFFITNWLSVFTFS